MVSDVAVMRLSLLMLLVVAGCAPEAADPEIRQSITGAVGEILHPSEVYVRFLEKESTLVVFERLEGAELARGPATSGARYPLSLAGRPCELESRGTVLETDVVTTERPQDSTNPLPMPSRERKTLVAKVTLRCADGPAPGIRAPASVQGWRVVAWLPLALLFGVLGGVLHSRGGSKELAALGLWFVGVVAAFVVGWRLLDDVLCLTVPVLAIAVGGAGATATLLWANDRATRVRFGAVGVVLAAFVGPCIIAAKYALWAGGAPLAAVGITLVVAVAALAYAVSGPSR